MNLNIIINQSIKPFKAKLGRNERDVHASPRSTAKFHLHQCAGVNFRPRTVKITDENTNFGNGTLSAYWDVYLKFHTHGYF